MYSGGSQLDRYRDRAVLITSTILDHKIEKELFDVTSSGKSAQKKVSNFQIRSDIISMRMTYSMYVDHSICHLYDYDLTYTSCGPYGCFLGWRRGSATNWYYNVSQSYLSFFQPNVTSSSSTLNWTELTAKLRSARRIIYNRVPKCGSKFWLAVMTAAQRSFKRHHQFRSGAYKIYRPNATEMMQLLTEVDTFDRTQPWLFDRHLHFVDFTSYNRTTPLYINVVRKPVDRFLSKYYYRRRRPLNGTRLTEAKYTMTFEQCVHTNNTECLTENAYKIGSVLYFCGQAEICITPSKEALSLAKRNVHKHFGVVALIEDTLNGVALLEQTTPTLFRGLTSVAASMINTKVNTAPKTYDKPPKAMEIMEQRLGLENDFYAFIKQRYELFKQYFATERFVNETLVRLTNTGKIKSLQS